MKVHFLTAEYTLAVHNNNKAALKSKLYKRTKLYFGDQCFDVLQLGRIHTVAEAETQRSSTPPLYDNMRVVVSLVRATTGIVVNMVKVHGITCNHTNDDISQ